MTAAGYSTKTVSRSDLLRWSVTLLAAMAAGCALTLFLYLVLESGPIFVAEGWGFFIGKDWWVGEIYGALPMISGSLMVTALALFLVLPLALSGAVFTSEILPPGLRLMMKSAMELFAGVPGIIYGLLGVTVLSVWVKETFNLIDGNTLLTAGILLGIMILPTILTLSEDALQAVPGEYRDTSLSLGMTKLQTAWSVVVPHALPGLAGAVFLGLGRAMGETIAVMLVIGGVDRIAQPWYNIFAPGQSIPSKLGREAAEALGSGLQWSALLALGLILFVMVMALSFAGNMFLKRTQS